MKTTSNKPSISNVPKLLALPAQADIFLDHCALWIDFVPDVFFLGEINIPTNFSHQKLVGLKSATMENYLYKLNKHFRARNTPEQVAKLQEDLVQGLTSIEDGVEKYKILDQ
eukprot:5893030-Ditylum_brightwellii.AAC.1